MSLLDLLDWRRSTTEMYGNVRASPGPESAWQRFRERRDELFRSHPQSPLDAEQKRGFTALAYFPYAPAWRLFGRITPMDRDASASRDLVLPEGTVTLLPFATVRFDAAGGTGGPAALTLFWIGGYGGGLFLPFRDLTAGRQTYGGGRYLFDTIKGADLGASGGSLVLDFNFSYNPSCAYSPRWVCPLAPPDNHLPFPIDAGERAFG